MPDKATENHITCRHCGATVPQTSVEIESITQPQPKGPWYLLEVWTCAECEWRNVLSKVENERR